MALAIKDFMGHSRVLQAEKNELTYLLREAGFYMEQSKEHLSEDIFKKCEQNADKNYEKWVKEKFEIDQVAVDVTLKP